MQQTVGGIRTALDRATKQTDVAATLMREVKAGADQPLADNAVTELNALMGAVKKAADLRTGMLTARQKRLFQVRPLFETSLTTLMNELARGGAMESGVASVRDVAQAAKADEHDPTIEAVNQYRLAMSRVQAAAMMFMATGTASAANDVRDAATEATANMAKVLSGPAPDAIKADARTVDSIGKAIAAASAELISPCRGNWTRLPAPTSKPPARPCGPRSRSSPKPPRIARKSRPTPLWRPDTGRRAIS